MPSKQAIIDNIEEYSAAELVQYIKDGIVSFNELCDETDGYFPASVRKEVQRMLAGSEDDDWQVAKQENTKDALFGFLRAYPTSNHREEARNLLQMIAEQSERQAIENDWNNVDKNDIDDLNRFINRYPTDSRARDARKLITKLEREEFLGFDVDSLIKRVNDIQTDQRVQEKDVKVYETIKSYLDRKKISSQDLLDVISRDNNFLRASVIEMLITDGYFRYQDFLHLGIDRKFIQHLAQGERKQTFDSPERLDKINKQCTEVYFWGIPSSGKSCALGAVLSIANNGMIARSMSKDNDCQGYGYMTRLAQLFKSDGSVGTLPEGTSIYSTYEMGFDLEDENGATHPITCIDLAGELVRCMYKSDAKEALSEDEVEALDTLTRILIDNRTRNRKIHFFVLEYGGENRKYEGLSQTEYLDAALRYIERTGIFKEDTDAIYLMFTKVDKANALGGQLVQILTDYTETNYKGFFQGLEKICKDCEINGGKVERIPFTLGQVCFQDYCLFNGASAGTVVKKLLIRSKGFKNGKAQKIQNWFKK